MNLQALLHALYSPIFYVAVIAGVLAILLHISIRNEGWHPPFRQLRIRRALILTLLAWGLFLLAR